MSVIIILTFWQENHEVNRITSGIHSHKHAQIKSWHCTVSRYQLFGQNVNRKRPAQNMTADLKTFPI